MTTKELVPVTQTPWFQEMVDEIYQYLDEYRVERTELVFNLKWGEITAKHNVGKLLDKYAKKAENVDDLLQETAEKLDISTRSLYDCMALYRKYPKVDSIPEGKSIGFTRLMRVYVKGDADLAGCLHKRTKIIKVEVCLDCGKRHNA
jgi:hypothetical protein